MITLLQKKPWRWLPWFIAGLFGILLVSLPSLWQPTTVTLSGSSNQAAALQQLDVHSEVTSYLNPAFEEVAASHLEPNFY